jgi:hypothetical protein
VATEGAALANRSGESRFRSLLNISILNPLDDPNWDDSLFTASQATFFHSQAWARVLSESYGYVPRYFVSTENSKLRGLFPVMEIRSFLTGKRGVGLPFSDMCDPLADDIEAFDALFKQAATYGREAGWKHLEIRGGNGFLREKPFYAQHFVHNLDLSADEVKVSGRFKPNTRRNIRKAEKEGVQVTLERSIESIAAFYKLNCGTRRHHGLPPQPWMFFKKIYEHVIAPGKGFVVLAHFQKRLVAAAVFTLYRDQAIYKYGASTRSFHHLKPNNLVMWEAIRWCCRNGIHRVHFGRTEPENRGLLRYKRNWGTEERVVRYFKFDFFKNLFVASSSAPKPSYVVFKHMPEFFLKIMGNMLYRHAG